MELLSRPNERAKNFSVTDGGGVVRRNFLPARSRPKVYMNPQKNTLNFSKARRVPRTRAGALCSSLSWCAGRVAPPVSPL
jgi:hypothetical protein